MICPVCNHTMVIVEHENIELDYCTGCHGVWFDSGELELLLEAAGLEDYEAFAGRILGSGEASSAEKKRKCPICTRKMKKKHIDEAQELLIDACPRAHGIWFDGGEVEYLLKLVSGKSGGAGSPGKVLNFLGGVFKY